MYAGGWRLENDELKGKNKENKGVFVFGSSFSGLSFRVFVFEDEQRGKNKENKGVLVFGS